MRRRRFGGPNPLHAVKELWRLLREARFLGEIALAFSTSQWIWYILPRTAAIRFGMPVYLLAAQLCLLSLANRSRGQLVLGALGLTHLAFFTALSENGAWMLLAAVASGAFLYLSLLYAALGFAVGIAMVLRRR